MMKEEDAPRIAPRSIAAESVAAFVRGELFSPDRKLPVVGLTTKHGRLLVDAASLAAATAGRAVVVTLETGDVTSTLSGELPRRLDVYGGAARVWRPGLNRESAPGDHPLVFIFDSTRATEAEARILAALEFETVGVPKAPSDAGGEGAIAAPTHAASQPGRRHRQVLSAEVIGIEGGTIRVRVEGVDGTVGYADQKLSTLAQALHVGQHVRVFAVPGTQERPRFSMQGLWAPSESAPSPRPSFSRIAPPQRIERFADAVVHEIGSAGVFVVADGRTCRVEPADLEGKRLPEDVRVGQYVRVRSTDRLLGTLPVVEVRGVWQDAWRRLGEICRVNDVVWGQVCHIEPSYMLVEVLTEAALLVPLAELDYTRVRHPGEMFKLGERVKGVVLTLETKQRKGTLSIKRAYPMNDPRALSLGLGHAPFLSGDADEVLPASEAETEVTALRQELDAALEDRDRLREENKALKRQLADLKRSLRDAVERPDAASAQESTPDPTESEASFTNAVRASYQRQVIASERDRHPLQRMRIGARFLEDVRQIEGVSIGKVVDVCAQVACLIAIEIPAREVHMLRLGAPGTPVRERERDGAKAWRCSIQIGTASARRLHWWDVPGKDGRTIEFASVGLHDDFDIPT